MRSVQKIKNGGLMSKTKKLILLLFLLISSTLFSQVYIILDVHVQGNERINRDLILATSGLRIGDNFVVDQISHAIRSLYNLGVFSDVNVTIEEINRGLRLNIIVEELPVVNSFRYVGNKAISKGKIDEVGIIRIGTYWSPIVQAENTRRLLAEYQSKGHYIVDIEYIVREVADGLDIRIVIEEGKKTVVRAINIHGNREIETKKILKTMKTKHRRFLRSGKWEEERLQEDLVAIIEYYNKEGFLDARIISHDEYIEENRYKIINIYIEEGERFFFRSLSISGNVHFNDELVLSNFSFRENDIFNMEAFNKQLGSVAEMYFEDGYIYADFDPHILKDANYINVNLVIVENTRAQIHKVHITGNTKTKEKVIRRQLVIAPGDFFRRSRVIRSQQNVYNLGFFGTDMGLDYMPINMTGDVDLYLSVTDTNVGTIGGSMGFNSRDKIVLGANLAHNNLFGNHWQGNMQLEYSRSAQNIDLSFTNPYFLDTDILIGFNIYHTQRDWYDFNYRIYTNGGGVRLGYPIKLLDHARAIAGYSLYTKRYEIRNSSLPVSPSLQDLHEEGRQYTSAVNLTLMRDSRDNIFFPTSGSRLILYNELAGGALGGDFNYYKQIGEVSWFTPAFLTTVLRIKARYGYITDYGHNHHGVPPDERFYLGGTGPDGVRGYADRSIGPQDGEGGTRAILFSSELGIPISTDVIVGLLFFDTGNSLNKFGDFNFRSMKKGAGVGVRVRTPIGLLGFDYAHNFEERKWEPHIQINSTF